MDISCTSKFNFFFIIKKNSFLNDSQIKISPLLFKVEHTPLLRAKSLHSHYGANGEFLFCSIFHHYVQMIFKKVRSFNFQEMEGLQFHPPPSFSPFSSTLHIPPMKKERVII